MKRVAYRARVTTGLEDQRCATFTGSKSAAEVAALFDVARPITQFNAPKESYPGSPGLVVRKQAGERILQSITRGFPYRPTGMKPEFKPKAVNNIADLNKGHCPTNVARRAQRW